MQKKSSDEKLKAIHDRLQKLGSTNLDFRDQIKQKLIEQEDDFDDFLTKIENAVQSIKRPTSVDVLTGMLAALSAVSTLHPIGPEVISKLNLATSLMRVLSGKDNKFETEVTNSIRSALTEFSDSGLEEDTEGAVAWYKISFDFLKKDSPISTEHDVSMVMSNVPINSHAPLMGKLGKKIEVHNKSKDTNEALRAIRYTELYVKLAVYRSCILLMEIKTISPVNAEMAERVMKSLKGIEEADTNVLNFLTNPVKSRALFFAYWNPSTTPTILMYLEYLQLKLNLPNLCKLGMSYTFYKAGDSTSRECFGLERKWRLFSSGVMKVCHMNGILWKPSYDYQFYFESISEVDSIFHIRSMKKPHLYVYMGKDWNGQCYACNCEPGPQGQWKIIYLKNHNYILSTVMWPDWFLFGSSYSYGSPIAPPYFIPPPTVWTDCNLKGQKTRPSEFCISGASYSE